MCAHTKLHSFLLHKIIRQKRRGRVVLKSHVLMQKNHGLAAKRIIRPRINESLLYFENLYLKLTSIFLIIIDSTKYVDVVALSDVKEEVG